MYTQWYLFNHLDTLCSTSFYCFSGGKSFDLLFSRGKRKVGFPFSNFYLPSCATATVCWPVNLPIIAHSVVGEEESVCVRVRVHVCSIHGQDSLLPLYIRCNTCRVLTKGFFLLPVDSTIKRQKHPVWLHLRICDRLCICLYPVKHVLHSGCVFCMCVHS